MEDSKHPRVTRMLMVWSTTWRCEKYTPLGSPWCRVCRGGGLEFLVEIREVVFRGCMPEHVLVLCVDVELRVGQAAGLVYHHYFLHGLQPVPDGLDEAQEIGMDDYDAGPGVVHRVLDLVWRKPPVDGEQHSPHHGDCEVALQVAVGIVVQDTHGVPLDYAQRGEAACQP